MHIISRQPFAAAARIHPNQRQALMDFYRILSPPSMQFRDPDTMRQWCPSLDNFVYRDRWWVINIGGNHLRLIAAIDFEKGFMYVKHILTHAEYDEITDKYRRGEL